MTDRPSGGDDLAPIAMFTYNRLAHTRAAIEALAKNELAALSKLIIYSDGPKNESDAAIVEEVRNYLRKVTGFRNIEIRCRPANRGLAQSIITGVSEVVNRFGRVIVMEDDLVSSPYYLTYMNDALTLYAHCDDVICIHGYCPPITASLPQTFFLRGADCWGWGTWKRGWDLFESDGTKLLSELERRKLLHEFDLNGAYGYAAMLREQIAGRNDSWAVRWHASAFLQEKLTLHPRQSLIQNIGFDGSGRHCGASQERQAKPSTERVLIERQPLTECAAASRAFEAYYRGESPTLWMRLYKAAKKVGAYTPLRHLLPGRT